MNTVIRVLNAVPPTKKIKRIDLPDIKVPGLKLPNIDLEPDLSAVIAVQKQALEAGGQNHAAVNDKRIIQHPPPAMAFVRHDRVFYPMACLPITDAV